MARAKKSEETKISEIESITSDGDSEITLDNAEITDSLMSGDTDVTSDMVLDEVTHNQNNIINDENEPFNEDEQKYALSYAMFTLLDGAAFRKQILTGRLTGIQRTRLGPVAVITYNGGSASGELAGSATILISAEQMGLDENAIRNRVLSKLRASGIISNNKEVDDTKKKVYDKYVNIERRAVITAMLGAKVDFIVTNIVQDLGVVTGNRAAAMEIKRRNFAPTPTNPIPNISAGYKGIARVILVSPRFLSVEFSGYVINMNPRQVSPLAVDISRDYKVGDEIRVIVSKVTENGVRLVSFDNDRIDVKRKVLEYKRNDIVTCEVYFVNRFTGHYYLRLPNGCRGIAYYEKTDLRVNPTYGTKVIAEVTGYSKEVDTVRLSIRSSV